MGGEIFSASSILLRKSGYILSSFWYCLASYMFGIVIQNFNRDLLYQKRMINNINASTIIKHVLLRLLLFPLSNDFASRIVIDIG